MGKMITLKASDGFELAAYRADPAGKPKGLGNRETLLRRASLAPSI